MEIDRRIRAGKYPNARQLAADLEVSERTIYQDREFLVERLGAPLAFDRRRGGWYYTDATWVLPSTMVTQGELLAFFLSIEVARRYLGTAFEGPLRSAVAKITAGLKDQVVVDLEDLRSAYAFATPSTVAVKEQLLVDLGRAIRERRRVRMHYYTASRDSWQTRTVEPYYLYNLRGDWYLVAFDHFRGQMRVFQTGRVDWWEVLPEGFVRNPRFSLEEWLAQAFQVERGEEVVEVAVRFDSYQARYIRERLWHPTQEVEELPDGGLILRLRTGGLAEVRRWVMGYGSHAEVLAPEELRREVAAEARAMARLYGRRKRAPASSWR
ncbi:MAG: WYL domain-containing protein [Firmicutes bacterium]|nr:WYL domain-containing protein [Bacillota bacterium]